LDRLDADLIDARPHVDGGVGSVGALELDGDGLVVPQGELFGKDARLSRGVEVDELRFRLDREVAQDERQLEVPAAAVQVVHPVANVNDDLADNVLVVGIVVAEDGRLSRQVVDARVTLQADFGGRC